MSWIWQNGRRKGKTVENMFDCLFPNAFRLKIILVWEIIMIDKFWFNQKSLWGLLGLAMWKRKKQTINTSWYIQIAFSHVMEI